MRVLVTGAASALGQEVAAALAADENAQLRLLDDCAAQRQDVEWIAAGLTDPDAVRQAVRDVDVVVHTGEPPPAPESEEALLDRATRGTHVLLQAAVEAGVKRFVYGSTLEVFRAYPDTVYVTEYYKPLPPTEMAVLARYLGEMTCREFAREHPITVTALRLGKLVREEEVCRAGTRFDVGRYSGCSAGVLRGVGARRERVPKLGAALGCVPHCRAHYPSQVFARPS